MSASFEWLSRVANCLVLTGISCIIIIVVVVVLSIFFMEGIYTHIPETNHVPREHCVAIIVM